MCPSSEYDVVILGGGPAGIATALALNVQGISNTLLLESGHYEADRVGESIPPDARIPLSKLGVWQAFEQAQHDTCLGSCSSWGDDELGYNDFLFNPHGTGWHLDRKRFDAMLANTARAQGIDIRTGTRFADFETSTSGLSLNISNKASNKADKTQKIHTRFVVDASGMRSAFARRMGAERVFLDQLVCVYGFFIVPEEATFSKLTMLEAVEYGWWYAAKLPSGRLAVALACDVEWLREAQVREQNNWLRHFVQTRHLKVLLKGCRFIDKSLLICPAPSFVLDRVTDDYWLAVGDAASTYDPIASQGIYKAMNDGLLAAETIFHVLKGKKDKLEQYATAVNVRFEDYVNNRNYFYQLEQRWPEAPFWKNRHEKTTLSA